MKGGKSPLKPRLRSKGYTIVEVMIVLAVSGVMFVIAANFINGKQAKTSFTQGVNNTAALVQNVIDDVVDGKYSDIALNCKETGGAVDILTNFAKEQGTNSQCVFRGKLIHFYGANNDRSKYEIIPLVDLRRPPLQFETDLGRINSNVSLVQQGNVPQRLSAAKGTVNTASLGTITPNAYNIGFIQSSGERNESNTGYKSGAQTVGLVYVKSGAAMPITSIAVPASLPGTLVSAQSFKLCITDGTRYATISVGTDDNGQLTVTKKMLGETTC